jgi:hypothetical protein
MNRSAKSSGAAVRAAVLGIIVLAVATALVEPAFALGESPTQIQEETIVVSCFKGNLDAGNYIGNLTITTPQNAGQRCNSAYYDCQDECLGCFTDNQGHQVCYDNEGRKLAK